MTLRNLLYASILSAAALTSCKSTLPDLRNPEVWGEYEGVIDGMPVTYEVMERKCRM